MLVLLQVFDDGTPTQRHGASGLERESQVERLLAQLQRAFEYEPDDDDDQPDDDDALQSRSGRSGPKSGTPSARLDVLDRLEEAIVDGCLHRPLPLGQPGAGTAWVLMTARTALRYRLTGRPEDVPSFWSSASRLLRALLAAPANGSRLPWLAAMAAAGATLAPELLDLVQAWLAALAARAEVESVPGNEGHLAGMAMQEAVHVFDQLPGVACRPLRVPREFAALEIDDDLLASALEAVRAKPSPWRSIEPIRFGIPEARRMRRVPDGDWEEMARTILRHVSRGGAVSDVGSRLDACPTCGHVLPTSRQADIAAYRPVRCQGCSTWLLPSPMPAIAVGKPL